MTACAYISPLGRPVLIADTVVTRSILDPKVAKLKNRKELPKILPSTSPGVFELKGFRQTRLTRKIYILNDEAAIAIAGDRDKIEDYLALVSGLIDVFMEYDRPMRKLGDYANQIHKDAGKIVLEVLGAGMEDGGNSHNYFSFRPPKVLTSFGKTSVIGSGADELGALLQKYNDQTAYTWPQLKTDADIYELIRGTVSACINSVILEERLLDQASMNSWGGFLEYAYYDLALSKWRRGPRSIHMICHIVDHGSANFELILNPKIIVYEPGDKHGCILSVTMDSEDDVMLDCWLLEDLLNGNSKDIAAMYFDKAYWRNWKCESATITIIPSEEGTSQQTIHKSIEQSQVNEIVFDINDDEVRMGIKDNLKKELIEIACRVWGLGDPGQ